MVSNIDPTLDGDLTNDGRDVDKADLQAALQAAKDEIEALQTALDAKAPLASPTFTGTVVLPNDTVAYAKIQNVTATDRLLGRDTAAAGDIEELTVGGGVEFTGSGGIQRSALTGNVTATAGSNATTIATAAVTNAMLANMAQSTVKGRAAAAGTGAPVDLSVAQLQTILGFSANGVSLVAAANYAAMRGLLDLEAGTDFYSISAANAAFLAAAGTGLVEQIAGHIETAANKTYVLDLKAPYAYTINSLAAKTASGTCTAKLTIDGVDVTGITALAVSSTEDFDDASAANAVSVGNTVALVISSNAAALDVTFTVKITR